MRVLVLSCFVLFGCLATVGCDVDVKDKGKAPKVHVDVESGRLPDVDVRGPDVDVGTKEKEITVPEVDVSVKKKKTTITVPDIKVDVPQENEKTIDASSNADEQ
jgi:hypothetical protein